MCCSVVIRRFVVGADDQRSQPIPKCGPLRHHILFVEGAPASTATVLPRYSVSVPAFSLFGSFICLLVCSLFSCFYFILLFLFNDSTLIFLQLCSYVSMLAPRARVQTKLQETGHRSGPHPVLPGRRTLHQSEG